MGCAPSRIKEAPPNSIERTTSGGAHMDIRSESTAASDSGKKPIDKGIVGIIGFHQSFLVSYALRDSSPQVSTRGLPTIDERIVLRDHTPRTPCASVCRTPIHSRQSVTSPRYHRRFDSPHARNVSPRH